jgi:hypothetical protein
VVVSACDFQLFVMGADAVTLIQDFLSIPVLSGCSTLQFLLVVADFNF